MERVVLAVCLVFILVLSVKAASQAVQIQPIIPDSIGVGVKHEGLFKVVNTGYAKGSDAAVSVNLCYDVWHDGAVVSEGCVRKTLKSYTRSGTGTFIANRTGEYILCGWTDQADKACKNFSVSESVNAEPAARTAGESVTGCCGPCPANIESAMVPLEREEMSIAVLVPGERRVIYESSTAKTEDMAPSLLVISFGLMLCGLVLTKI